MKGKAKWGLDKKGGGGGGGKWNKEEEKEGGIKEWEKGNWNEMGSRE